MSLKWLCTMMGAVEAAAPYMPEGAYLELYGVLARWHKDPPKHALPPSKTVECLPDATTAFCVCTMLVVGGYMTYNPLYIALMTLALLTLEGRLRFLLRNVAPAYAGVAVYLIVWCSCKSVPERSAAFADGHVYEGKFLSTHLLLDVHRCVLPEYLIVERYNVSLTSAEGVPMQTATVRADIGVNTDAVRSLCTRFDTTDGVEEAIGAMLDHALMRAAAMCGKLDIEKADALFLERAREGLSFFLNDTAARLGSIMFVRAPPRAIV